MGACTTVGVDNDLATRQTTVSLGATDHKAACGVDQVAGVFEPLFGQHGFDDFFNHGFNKGGLHFGAIALLRAVLGGKHHRVNAVGLTVDIAHGHLALRIRAQEGQATVFSQMRLTLHQAVCVVNGSRHEFRRF